MTGSTLIEDCRAALMSATTEREIDETVVAICKKFGGKQNVPAAVRTAATIARAALRGKAAG